MSTRVIHSNEAALYYITFTCHQWLPLFELCNAHNLVYKWFDFLNEKYNIKTTAYTIMPNHVHCILFFPSKNYDLNKIVSNSKRFIAYDLIKHLQEKRLSKTILQLKEGLTERDITKGQNHKVFVLLGSPSRACVLAKGPRHSAAQEAIS